MAHYLDLCLIVLPILALFFIKSGEKSKVKYSIGVALFIIILLMFVVGMFYSAIEPFFISHGKMIITSGRVKKFLYTTISIVFIYVIFIKIAVSDRK